MTTMRAYFAANYRAIGSNLWARRKTFFTTSPRWFRLRQSILSYTDRQLLDISWRAVEGPANSPELLAHVRRHLPGWPGFRTRVYTYLNMEWNSIYGQLELPASGAALQEEVEPPGQRDLLWQLFKACPKGSYGYYAQWGLAPFLAMFGNAGAATIHLFFASNVGYLKQPMSTLIAEIMSDLETRYWNSQQDVLDHFAGLFLTERKRQRAVVTPALLRKLVEGERIPDLPPGETLSDKQLEEIADKLNTNLDGLDQEAATKFAQEVYEQAVADNRLKFKS